MTFRSRARGGSWFEKRLARIAESGNQRSSACSTRQGGAERRRLPAGRVQRGGRDHRSERNPRWPRVRLNRGLPSAARRKHFRVVFREISSLRVVARIGRCCPDSFTSFFTVALRAHEVNLPLVTTEELGGTAFAHPMRSRQRRRATRRPGGLSHRRSRSAE